MTTAETGVTMLATAEAFRPRILAAREEVEAERRIPAGLAAELARAGFFRMSLPTAYGGLDLLPTESLAVVESLARADGSVAWCVLNANTYWTAAATPEQVAREVFSGPEVVFANSTQPRGRADVEADGYRVNGRWSLVSGCQIADWLHLSCVVHEQGAPVLLPNGTPKTVFVYVRTADAEIIDTWSVGGLRGTGSNDVVVRDLLAPRRLASTFFDPPVLPEPRYRVPSWTRVIPSLGSLALGLAQTAIETVVELGGAKRPERMTALLGEDRGAQARLAQAEALVSSARLFLYDAVRQVQAEAETDGGVTFEARARARVATSHAVTSAVQAVDLMYLTGGATSLYTSGPLERAFRDVHAIPQHIAVHPRVMEQAGRVLFGLEPESPIL